MTFPFIPTAALYTGCPRRFRQRYGTIIFIVPGFVICITPPQLHISLQLLLSAGFPPIRTVGLPGTHGADIAGTHGIGVSTPNAAAVAAATVGLPGQLHIPNGMIFTSGLLSIIFAIGIVVTVLLSGSTLNTEGAIPNAHMSIAPPHTAIAILTRSFQTFIS
jgi:hypothetical protein